MVLYLPTIDDKLRAFDTLIVIVTSSPPPLEACTDGAGALIGAGTTIDAKDIGGAGAGLLADPTPALRRDFPCFESIAFRRKKNECQRHMSCASKNAENFSEKSMFVSIDNLWK